jgi:hypothetical protein
VEGKMSCLLDSGGPRLHIRSSWCVKWSRPWPRVRIGKSASSRATVTCA